MNAAQIGEPGTGKTYNLLSLFPFADRLNKPVVVIDVDNKLSGDPLFEPFITKRKLIVHAITTKQFSGSLKAAVSNMKAAPQNAPGGYYAIADAVDAIKAIESQYSVAVLDTLTIAQEHLRQLLLYNARKAQFEFAEWGLFLSNLEKLFTAFYDINVPLKIINMHSAIEKDDVTGMLRTLPLIDGSFKNKAGMYVAEFYQCFATPAAGQQAPKYRWKTRPDGRFNARSNIFQTETDQDWTPVWQKILSQLASGTTPQAHVPPDLSELTKQGK